MNKHRNPERIAEILDLLKIYWNKNPDLRLGQILENIADIFNKTCYYMEDDIVINFFKTEKGENK